MDFPFSSHFCNLGDHCVMKTYADHMRHSFTVPDEALSTYIPNPDHSTADHRCTSIPGKNSQAILDKKIHQWPLRIVSQLNSGCFKPQYWGRVYYPKETH